MRLLGCKGVSRGRQETCVEGLDVVDGVADDPVPVGHRVRMKERRPRSCRKKRERCGSEKTGEKRR